MNATETVQNSVMPHQWCLLAVGPNHTVPSQHRQSFRVGFLPWQKLFLPGQWEKMVKTVVKTGKNSGVHISFHYVSIS